MKTLSNEQKDLAAQLVREGNRIGAREALKRKKMYIQQLNSTHGKIANLRKVVDTIRSTEDNVALTKVLQQADVTIQASLAEASPEITERTMVSLEESMERASMVEESLTDSSLTDIGLEDEWEALDDELAALEAEVEAATSTATPASPVTTPVSSKSTPVAEEKTSSKSDELEDEIAKMKKQLEKELGG